MFRRLARQPYVVLTIWALLAVALVWALAFGQWDIAYLALATFLLSLLPAFFASRFGLRIPPSFFAAILVFTFSTIFLGEAFDFYNRYPWWDVAMHSGSAMGFGIIGVLFMMMLFHGDRYAAPPWAIAFFGFCFAMTVGAVWEIFEFAMDQSFGLNMQKSGLVDTMWDLIVNAIGAAIGSFAGFLYLKGQEVPGFAAGFRHFIRANRSFFRKTR